MVLERKGGLIGGEALMGLSKPARKEAIKKALAKASESKDGREAVLKALQEAGLTEKQAANALKSGVGTARRGNLVLKAISKDASKRLNGSLRDIFGGTGGLGASASPGKYTGSASGNLNTVIVNVFRLDQ